MKILEAAKGKEIRCGWCKALLSFMPSDIKTKIFGACDYAGDSGDRRRYIKCLACGQTIFLS
jgi:hypothetical protein